MLFGFVLKFCTFKFEFEVNQLCIIVFCVGFSQFRVHLLAELRAQAPASLIYDDFLLMVIRC